MFISEKIVYTELHKTGGTHICMWLSKILGGCQVGKHNRIPRNLWNKFIIGSIRNPWDWYVSLWAYGCEKKGSVYLQSTRKLNFSYINNQLHSELGQRWIFPDQWVRQVWNDMLSPYEQWKDCYTNYTDNKAFRKWLKLIMNPKRRFDIGEGYGFSPVSLCSGLLTYRYLKLYSKLDRSLYSDKSLANFDGIRRALKERNLVQYVIRNESLEEDFLEALKLADCEIGHAKRTAFLDGRKKKTNASVRLPAAYYYDSESVGIVAEREQVIIDMYQYVPPFHSDAKIYSCQDKITM